MAEQPEQISIPITWVGIEDEPVRFANQFLSQFLPEGEFIITFGQFSPPILTADTPSKRMKQAQIVDLVPISPVARIALTPERMRSLIRTLQENLANFEQAREGTSDANGND